MFSYPFGRKTKKEGNVSSVINGTVTKNVSMKVDGDGKITGVPDEWKDMLKDIYKVVDEDPTEENILTATNVIETSFKRTKTLKEGKHLKLREDPRQPDGEDGPVAIRDYRKLSSGEVLQEMEKLCILESPWQRYIKVCFELNETDC